MGSCGSKEKEFKNDTQDSLPIVTPPQPNQTVPARKRPYRILSIDGGGIRGIIPATILVELEKRLGQPLAEAFDLIAGTSAGGLIACSLALKGPDGHPKYTAEQILNIFVTRSKEIFPSPEPVIIPDFFNQGPVHLWEPQLLTDLKMALFQNAKYSAKPFNELLKEYFGDARLSDTVCELLVPVYELQSGERFFFRTSDVRRTKAVYSNECNFRLRDVIISTSSNPGAFEPHKLAFNIPGGVLQQEYQAKLSKVNPQDAAKDHMVMIDGGVFVTNPALAAITEVRRTDTEDRFNSFSDCLVVSIGTGTVEKGYQIPTNNLGWVTPLLEIMQSAGQEFVAFQLHTLLPPKQYYRFQTDLSEHISLDDVQPESIKKLQDIGTKLASERSAWIDEIVAKLKDDSPANPTPPTFRPWQELDSAFKTVMME